MRNAANNTKLVLLFAMTLVFVYSSALFASAYTPPAAPESVTIDPGKFLFIDTHTNRNGIGEVDGYMYIDFPTYSYNSNTNTLSSWFNVNGFNDTTKLVIGGGMSLSGTAGSGAGTGLTPYSTTFKENEFYVDADYTIHIFYNSDWRTVKVGETWTNVVETKPMKGTGKYVNTYTVKNYGLLDKSQLHQPTPRPTQTNIPSPTSTPTPVVSPTQMITRNLSGFAGSDTNGIKDYSGFKVEVENRFGSAYTNINGYFSLDVSMFDTPSDVHTAIISKPGYLTRKIPLNLVRNNIELGSAKVPLVMLSGDANNDNAINMSDAILIAKLFNKTTADKDFNPAADFNTDAVINVADVVCVAKNFNTTGDSYKRPAVYNIHNTYANIDQIFNISMPEGGFAGITYKYSIESEEMIKFVSKTSSPAPYPDGFGKTTWTFEALRPGKTSITFTCRDDSEKYYIDILGMPPPPTTPTPPSTPTPSDNTGIDSALLSKTTISTNSEEKIVVGKNIIYCPTFQMAWDGLKGIIGGDVKLSANPPIADILNKGFPMENSLNPKSYLSMAGYGQKTIDNINTSLKEKFGESAPQLNNKIAADSIIAYSYLSKNSNFAKEFDNFDSMGFSTGSEYSLVKGFGIEQNSENTDDLSKQVQIYDYKSDDDFIVKLIPEDKTEEIILAKVAPDENLYKTYTSVMKRIDGNSPEQFEFKDKLFVPNINFNITHSYNDLKGQISNPGFEQYNIDTALQNTKFVLNRKGSILSSYGIIILAGSGPKPDYSKKLIFDGPFMVILKEKGAPNPYLTLWVDNYEILERAIVPANN
ncbi:dockerin type I domain-containing protein [Pseudobacteroides cellulosolvens]|uniref:Proteinase inhibitor I42, chagasin n=1 Tax=Pseudobacteroides cellulosolvens ATCC 35603 = DSM 2933 TaxID=398512 RepID=A0A0L6JUW6_9FIRM|nr:dockerin type I domain-containing protein [Pseudobacteroides cellulosolvens]KNY29623.1 Proteinase inhibitor I42, chagasin [Pseudobacteroides cellulosolvens ATCC 35603 = DSM 2933]